MLFRAVEAKLISGVRVASNGPTVSHLQFADDTVIFCDANEEEVRNAKAIIWCFEAMSGLKVNFFKSGVIGVGVEENRVMPLADIMGCRVSSLPVSYLGMPFSVGYSSKALRNPVVERVEHRLTGWKAEYLSIGGRITLIQIVLSNLLIYHMSLFKCPVSIVNELEKLRMDFFVAREGIQE